MKDKNLQSFENQDKIQRFVNGELSGGEMSEFESELKSNEGLKEEVRFSNNLNFTLQNKEVFEVNDIYKKSISELNIEPDYEALKEYGGDSSGFSFYKIILSSVVLLGLILGGMFATDSGIFAPSEAQLLADNYLTPFENIINAPEPGLLKNGMDAYDQKDWKNASKYLSDYLKNNDDPQVRFFLSVSQLFDNQDDKALNGLLGITDSQNFPQSEVQWYLALAYLKNDMPNEAIRVLDRLKSDSNPTERVNQLWEDLRVIYPEM